MPSKGDTYTLQTPTQLAAHIRSLRKARGLTQQALGAILGVSKARISQIERDPGAMSVGQFLQLLHALGARAYLDAMVAIEDDGQSGAASRGEW